MLSYGVRLLVMGTLAASALLARSGDASPVVESSAHPTAVAPAAPETVRSAPETVRRATEALRSGAEPVRSRPATTQRRVPAGPASEPHRHAAVRGTGRLLTVPGRSAVLGTGPLQRFAVQVEEGLDAAGFADQVLRTLGDPRGWGHGGRLAFQRVSTGPVAFTVVLASPATTDRLCAPLETNGIFSCYDSRGRAVINVLRWREGARPYSGHLAEYRRYVVNHEVGHALGHGHVSGCRADGLAPVMMQQTKSLGGCLRNAWPYP